MWLQVILSKARNLLRRSPFRFQDEWAAVLPGPWEAALGWLSLNYRHGLLPGAPQPTRGVPADAHQQTHDFASPRDVVRAVAERAQTVAMLDVGGSSVEVAVEFAEAGPGAALGGLLFVAEVEPTARASTPELPKPAALTFNVAGTRAPPVLNTPRPIYDSLLPATMTSACLYCVAQLLQNISMRLILVPSCFKVLPAAARRCAGLPCMLSGS